MDASVFGATPLLPNLRQQASYPLRLRSRLCLADVAWRWLGQWIDLPIRHRVRLGSGAAGQHPVILRAHSFARIIGRMEARVKTMDNYEDCHVRPYCFFRLALRSTDLGYLAQSLLKNS